MASLHSRFAWTLVSVFMLGCTVIDNPMLIDGSETSVAETGDGDGDLAMGDGDGDYEMGDGDGDPAMGDGDGDSDPCQADPGAEDCPCADSSTCDDGLLCLDGGVCEADPFDPNGDFARVDRMGMPAINTTVIASKDEYNAANPTDDAMFQSEILDSIQFLRDTLNDDLEGAGLVPCSLIDCLAVTAPFVTPDTLRLDYDEVSSFPIGRAPADPVIDITLAVLLLDLTEPGQDTSTLVGVLNPAANDVEFSNTFPYLAVPN